MSTATAFAAPVSKSNSAVAPAAVVDAVRAASAGTGVDFAYLMDKAATESGFNANAKASCSSAAGLFQFIDSTWLSMVRDHGAQHGLAKEASDLASGTATPAEKQRILALRKDPTLSAAMAAEYAKDNKAYLQSAVGGQIGNGALSTAHFLGASGAATFLKALRSNPNQPADQVSPAAADANPSVFYDSTGKARSVAQVYAKLTGGSGSQQWDVASASGSAQGGTLWSAGLKTLENATGTIKNSYIATMMLAQLGQHPAGKTDDLLAA